VDVGGTGADRVGEQSIEIHGACFGTKRPTLEREARRADTEAVISSRRPSKSLVLVMLAVIAGAALTGWMDGATPPSDAGLYAQAGATMLSGAWQHTYANPAVQSGPLELALISGAKHVGVTQRLFAVALDVVGAIALLLVAASFLGRRARALALFGLAAIALRIVGDMYAGGHPAELFIPLLWLLAAREARGGRTVRAGVLLGLAAGFEVWGILGVAVLVLAPRLRRIVPAALLAAALTFAIYLPFALGGDFHMLSYHWTIAGGLDARLFGLDHRFTWGMRLAEGAVVVCVGGAVALCSRRLAASVWLAPAAIASCRLVLDPTIYGYYWDTLLILLLIGAVGILVAPRELAARLAGRLSPT
jgi:hypothetical protein